MFEIGTSNRVTFNVNVSGTAVTPTVNAVVGEHPSHSYKAKQLEDGSWEAMIDLPKDTPPGKLPFMVEVLVNGRLFTPIKTTIDVASPPAPVREPEITVEPTVKVEPKVKPTPKKEPKTPKIVLKADEPTVPFRESAGLVGLAALAKTSPKALPPRRVTSVPEAEMTEPVKFSLVDLDKEVYNSEVTEAVFAPTRIPVTLIRGDVIYR